MRTKIKRIGIMTAVLLLLPLTGCGQAEVDSSPNAESAVANSEDSVSGSADESMTTEASTSDVSETITETEPETVSPEPAAWQDAYQDVVTKLTSRKPLVMFVSTSPTLPCQMAAAK